MINDELVICRRCNSDACYQIQEDGSHIRWQCMDCGFYTNTLMLSDSEAIKYLKDTSPELIKDLLFEDSDGFIWAPATINRPGIGLIFPDGTSVDNWYWAFAPEVLIATDQRYRYPVKGKEGEYHTHKVDMNKVQHFGQMDFILALQTANLLNGII